MPPLPPLFHHSMDLARTLALWAYFSLGYLVFFLPGYIAAHLFAQDRQAAFQKLNHRFFRIFFQLVRGVIPRLKFEISPEVTAIRGAVVVSNHRSYLDPILLISLFEKQKTIVKALYFRLPIFSWVLRTAGYIPASAKGELASQMLEQVEGLELFLAGGGNLFVFPEGTRGLDSPMGRLETGAFRLARRCHAAIEVIRIDHTDKLFPPGRFLFNTCRPPVISIRHIGRIAPGGTAAGIADQRERVRAMFARQTGKN